MNNSSGVRGGPRHSRESQKGQNEDNESCGRSPSHGHGEGRPRFDASSQRRPYEEIVRGYRAISSRDRSRSYRRSNHPKRIAWA